MHVNQFGDATKSLTGATGQHSKHTAKKATQVHRRWLAIDYDRHYSQPTSLVQEMHQGAETFQKAFIMEVRLSTKSATVHFAEKIEIFCVVDAPLNRMTVPPGQLLLEFLGGLMRKSF
jgi:hypothetical protein